MVHRATPCHLRGSDSLLLDFKAQGPATLKFGNKLNSKSLCNGAMQGPINWAWQDMHTTQKYACYITALATRYCIEIQCIACW